MITYNLEEKKITLWSNYGKHTRRTNGHV